MLMSDCSTLAEGARNTLPSVYAIWLMHFTAMWQPIFALSKCTLRESVYTLNKTGDIRPPCLITLLTVKAHGTAFLILLRILVSRTSSITWRFVILIGWTIYCDSFNQRHLENKKHKGTGLDILVSLSEMCHVSAVLRLKSKLWITSFKEWTFSDYHFQ